MIATTVQTAALQESYPLQAGSTGITPKFTFSQNLFSSWIEYVDAKPKTIRTYNRAIRQFMLYLNQNDISTPTTQDIKNFRDDLKKDHEAATVQLYLEAVKLFFKWTAQLGLYPNVADRVKGVEIDPEYKKDYLSAKQARRVLDQINQSTLKGKRDYAIICLMITTGVREIEVSRANVGDLSTKDDLGFTALYVQGKGRDSRNVYVKVEGHTLQALNEYLQERVKVSGKQLRAKEPLFESVAYNQSKEDPGRMSTRSIRKIGKNALLDAGLNSPRLTTHSFRHTAATLNLKAGGSLAETQELLRHKSISTTMRYSHILNREKNNSEERVGNAIFADN